MEIVRFACLIYRSTKIPASHVALLSSIQVNDRFNAACQGACGLVELMRSPPRSRAAGYRAAISCIGVARKRQPPPVPARAPGEPAQGSHFVALDGMRARGAVVDPPDVEHRAVEVD